MKEQKLIRIELLKNMFFNLILFTIMFSTFSILILSQVSRYLYTSVDQEIYQYKKQLTEISKLASSVSKNVGSIVNQAQISNEELTREMQNHIDKIANPRVITILRDSEGEIIATSLSVKSFAKYLEDIELDEDNLDKIYEISINSKYYYRGTTCKLTSSNGEKYYVDLLINTNSEKEMMKNFSQTLIVGTGILIILSIFISFYLAKKALSPIITAYKRQAEFVQNASHELRTPLTIIQAKQELLLQSPMSRIIDKSEDIALTLNETRRLSKMVKELMDLARADVNKTVINKTKTNLNSLVEEIASPYIDMAKLQEKKMNLELSCTKEINVDRNKIKQLMVILLDNALKYTEKNDSIDVQIRNNEDKFFITVKDTGIGISDEGLKHVFERFYREDKARSREKGGSGLGLSIAHTIVKNHGGTIKIVHNKPKGIIVIIKL